MHILWLSPEGDRNPNVHGAASVKSLVSADIVQQIRIQSLIMRLFDGTATQLNGIYDQKVDWFGLGANYYIRGQNLKLTFEYSYTNFDNNTATSVSSNKDFSTFISQLQLIF